MGQSSPRSPVPLSRRSVLTLGPTCVVAAVAACAGPDSSTSTPAGASTPATRSATGGPTATSRAPQVLTTIHAVPVGGGTVVSGILVVQPLAGLFKAFDARCPHLAAIVSPPQLGIITCREHGSTFVDIDGSLLQGPAPRGLKEIPIEIDGDKILTE
jgi:Rieske Fe-S protein